MGVMVKICGITCVDDALKAVNAGADVIGFVFAASPRIVTPQTAYEIRKAIPNTVRMAGVFVDEDPLIVDLIAETCGLDLLQFHGVETPGYCARFRDKAIKAMRVADPHSLDGIDRYDVHAILLDTFVEGQTGGTGQTFDWAIAAEAAKRAKIVLSGGLTADNVAAAVRTVRPVMVDVSSGVESSPGVKDAAKMKAFVENAKKER